MQNLYLLCDKLTDIQSFLSIINLKFLIFIQSLVHELFFIVFKQNIYLLKNFLLILHQLVMNAFPQPQNVVIDPIVVLTELLKYNDVLIALLFSIAYCLQQIDVSWLVIFNKMLLCMLYNAVRTKRHEALHIAAEVGEEFSGMIGAEYLLHLYILRHCGVLYSRHDRQLVNKLLLQIKISLVFYWDWPVSLNHGQECLKMFEMKRVTKIFGNKFQLNYFQSQMKAKRQIRGKSLQGTPYFISEDEKLGTGSYGSVYKAYNRQNPNEELVVKVISILDEDNQQSVQAELEVIRELPRHQNLVNCVKAHIASQKNLYIVMEYCNQGSLSKYIEKMALMHEQKIWDFIVQIAKGYQVLHDANLIHRDIKPDNILIHNKIFKLADFGLAKHIKDHTIKQNLSYAGSPLYIAPQITQNNIGSSKVDVFSLGSVLYQLAYDGTQPFYRQSDNYKNPQEYYKKRKTMKLTLKPRNKKGEIRSQQLRNLLQRMLEFDQEKRISWEQIFGHPRIDINKMKPKLALKRIISHQEEELQALRRSLIQVSRSSAKIEAILEKENARQQSEEMTLELIDFEQFLQHKELRNIEQEMFRLKITQLTILYCSGKITYIVKDNLKHKNLHKHILQCLQNLVIEGMLYLLKINDVINTKIGVVQEKVVKQLINILVLDKEKLVAGFKKEVEIFKSVMEYQKELQQIKNYDLRRYQSQLYNFLTQYCDYPSETKQKLSVIVSILIDVYDSSLKLSEMVQKDKIVWDKYQDMSQIQTHMDEICYNKLQPHEFHTYLMKKEHVKLQEINAALQKVGLLFA